MANTKKLEKDERKKAKRMARKKAKTEKPLKPRDPEFLVLDEPAQAIDFAGAAQLYELITTIREHRHCGILLISHDLHVVLGASDRVICLNRHVCCEGVPRAVAGHPEYMRLFGPDAAATLGLYRHSHDHTHTLSGDVDCGHAHD